MSLANLGFIWIPLSMATAIQGLADVDVPETRESSFCRAATVSLSSAISFSILPIYQVDSTSKIPTQMSYERCLGYSPAAFVRSSRYAKVPPVSRGGVCGSLMASRTSYPNLSVDARCLKILGRLYIMYRKICSPGIGCSIPRIH